MFSRLGFHVFPRGVSCFPFSLVLKRPRIHSRTEQPRASFTHGHPYVSEEHAFRIPMAPVEPLCLTPCCTVPQDKGDTDRANGRWACSHEGGRAEPRRPPYLGFMFSLVGFHVFPLRVSCFPSWGFMFSRSGFHVFPRGVSCSPFQDTYPRFHMPHLIKNQSGQKPVSDVLY
jgi:hypothetical protein